MLITKPQTELLRNERCGTFGPGIDGLFLLIMIGVRDGIHNNNFWMLDVSLLCYRTT